MDFKNYKQGTTIYYNRITADERISFAEKALLHLLINFTKENESEGKSISIELSNSELMEMLGIAKRTIINSKQHLQELGLLTVCNTKSDGANNKSIITLNQSFINTFFGVDIFKTESKGDMPRMIKGISRMIKRYTQND